jgi:hypothetical protein
MAPTLTVRRWQRHVMHDERPQRFAIEISASPFVVLLPL